MPAAVVALAAAAVTLVSAQAPQAPGRAGRLRQMETVLSSIDAGRPPAAAESERMLALLEKAERDGLAPAERTAAMTELYRELWRFRGFDAGPGEAAVNAAGRAAAAMFGFGARFSLDVHAPPPTAAEGQIGIVRRGRGTVPMLLVSDVVMPAEAVYGSFMERNADRYTMYAITLPGFGGARVPPRPAVMDFSRLAWLNAAERQMADLMVRENLRDTVVVGTAAGGYFAAALAARHPERVRAAVVVNGLVHSPLRSIADPGRPADLAERLERASRAAPIELTPAFWPPPSRETFRGLVENPPAGTGWGNFMAFAIRDAGRTREWTVEHLSRESTWRRTRYAAELRATDLTADLMKLQRPLLVFASLHDHLSPGIGTPVTAQWTELQLRAPGAPVTIAEFGDVRSYASLDAPDIFDRAVTDFLSGRPVASRTARAPAALPSPFASTSVYVGASEMRVEYYRPAVRGREIWGALVPYDALWRTGANDAPMITFSHDVMVEGHPLAAGTYTLVTVPGRSEWTVVFNRIPRQFGVFTYDPAFDALRVTVPSRPAAMREWFEISAEPVGPGEAELTFAWENIAVPLRVALKGS